MNLQYVLVPRLQQKVEKQRELCRNSEIFLKSPLDLGILLNYCLPIVSEEIKLREYLKFIKPPKVVYMFSTTQALSFDTYIRYENEDKI